MIYQPSNNNWYNGEDWLDDETPATKEKKRLRKISNKVEVVDSIEDL